MELGRQGNIADGWLGKARGSRSRQYDCCGLYNNKAESAIRWEDPAIGIKWPTQSPLLSDKDRRAQTLTKWLNSPSWEHFKH
jgi:hypothetical protein